ncbi:putative armadillo-like helical protein [Helianthus annuus]|nr:putative armadillo-like helical protein [Helianthus annuus]KAJ0955692.1 putative armadillo-like helical protein [Helianthus annuus]
MVKHQQDTLAGISRFRLLTDQISSLIIISHSIKVFSSKWALIRNKLNNIISILAVIPPEIQDSANCSLLNDVVQSVEETTQLAHKCIELSYTGKLLMQSDLDIICEKLNAHIKSLCELSSSDCFSPSAIVVSRPATSASKDDLKFYMNDLFSRFKIGNFEMKKQALICFNEVIQEDDRWLKIAMEVEGFVHVLVGFLSSKDLGVQEEVLKSLDMICGFELYKGVLVSIGVVAPLIRVLECGTHGGVTSLLRISAGECESSGELVGLACGVLKNLVGVDEIKRFVVEDGALQIFVNLVKSRNEVSQISSMEFLQAIAVGDQLVIDSIVNEGGIRVLVHVLDPKSSFSSKSRETSIRVIMSLCSDLTNLNSLVSYGFMDHILHFVQDGDIAVQESCLKAAYWLSGISDDFKKAMGDAGFIQVIIKIIATKPIEIRDLASKMLSNLVSIPKNRKRLVEDDQNVSLIMQSIDQEGTSTNRKLSRKQWVMRDSYK